MELILVVRQCYGTREFTERVGLNLKLGAV